jgi:hypothetical protein
MGGLLEVAGIRGFLDETQAEADKLDPLERAWRAAMTLCWNRFGTGEFGATDLWKLLQESPDLLLALNLRGNEAGQKTQLGQQLHRRKDRILDGRRLEHTGSSHGALRWRLVPAPPPGRAW